MIRKTVFILILFGAATAALAMQEPKVALADGDWAAQRAQIERDLADGKTYAEISRSDRVKVRESLDRISGALAGTPSVDALPDDVKVRVFNEQEQINTILTRAAADSRMVCDRDVPTGSRMAKTTCQTVAERDRRREADRDHLRKVQNGIGPVTN
jgi:hypothetical protein